MLGPPAGQLRGVAAVERHHLRLECHTGDLRPALRQRTVLKVMTSEVIAGPRRAETGLRRRAAPKRPTRGGIMTGIQSASPATTQDSADPMFSAQLWADRKSTRL